MVDTLIDVINNPNVVYFAIIGTIFSSGYIFRFYKTEGIDERGERIMGKAFKNAHYMIISLAVLHVLIRDWIINSEAAYINSVLLSLLIIDIVTAISIHHYSKST